MNLFNSIEFNTRTFAHQNQKKNQYRLNELCIQLIQHIKRPLNDLVHVVIFVFG